MKDKLENTSWVFRRLQKKKKMECHILHTCECRKPPLPHFVQKLQTKLIFFFHVLLDTEKEFFNQNKQQSWEPDS